MKRLGIDYGTKKIGIALTDDGGNMAFPHAVVPNNKDFFAYLEDLVQSRQIAEIVIGHSLQNSGEPNTVHAGVEALMMDITLQLGIPVHLEPEQYTTQAAMREQGRNPLTDASAAALIVESFIKKQTNA